MLYTIPLFIGIARASHSLSPPASQHPQPADSQTCRRRFMPALPRTLMPSKSIRVALFACCLMPAWALLAQPAPGTNQASASTQTEPTKPAAENDVLARLQAGAEAGDAEAQFGLGAVYYDQTLPGIERNYPLAVQWFSRAAQKGHAPAEFAMGLAYTHGSGVPKDGNQAAIWYEKAAAKGHLPAMHNLGVLLSDGKADPPDDLRRAINLLQTAADQGDADAQNALGVRYAYGIGLAQNYQQAIHWYIKAAKQGDPRAQTNLGILAEDGLGMPKDHAAAARWYEMAVARNHAPAKWRLADLLRNGWGTATDYARAMKLYREEAETGETTNGDFGMGYMYSNGLGVQKDLKLALQHYQRAAEAGSTASMYNASLLLDESDPQTAFKWKLKAAELGDASAQNNTGVAYFEGKGVERNTASALYWYAKSAQQGNELAMGNIKALLPERSHATVASASANLRAQPSTDAKVLISLPKGTRVYPIDTPSPGWREVFVESGYRLGYLSETVLQTPTPARTAQVSGGNDPWPAKPAPRPGYTTCNTNCRNGDCYRVYSNGKRVRFQAQQKWNPLTNQFEWDSGGC
ncbi:MAG: hypothetical protein QM612_03745 [Thermomonas sp.]|uniref:hypothetical protein n=1 Tax=Thermomonas sp. TaxID=1971895 RepID=UPI0039E45623